MCMSLLLGLTLRRCTCGPDVLREGGSQSATGVWSGSVGMYSMGLSRGRDMKLMHCPGRAGVEHGLHR